MMCGMPRLDGAAGGGGPEGAGAEGGILEGGAMRTASPRISKQRIIPVLLGFIDQEYRSFREIDGRVCDPAAVERIACLRAAIAIIRKMDSRFQSLSKKEILTRVQP